MSGVQSQEVGPMAIEAGMRELRSRRAVLLTAFGATGGALLGVLGRASGVRAANGDAVLLGNDGAVNDATATTGITTTTGHGLHATTTANAAGSHALVGEHVASGTPIGEHYGVKGTTNAIVGPSAGVFGEAVAVTTGAVYGVRGKATGEAATAVYGQNFGTTGQAVGVHGVSLVSPDGIGVLGAGEVAVKGFSLFGYAFNGEGKLHFSRSGIATINAGDTSVSVLAEVDTSSIVLATLQGTQAGIWIRGVQKKPAQDRFIVRLNAAPANDLKVGWLILD
jgi:hypothetical protein